MIVAALLLLMLLTVALTWRQSSPAPGRPRQRLPTLLITAGALLALIAGLCALLGFTLLVGYAAEPGRTFGRSVEDLVLAAIPVGALLVTALGIWICRRGRAQLRADTSRD